MYDFLLYEFDSSNIRKGLQYNNSYIKKRNSIVYDDGTKISMFTVKSERNDDYYFVRVQTKTDENDGELIHYSCTCPQYHRTGECKHIVGSVIKYFDDIFLFDMTNKDDYQLAISKNIIENFYKPKSNKIRKKIKLEITLSVQENWYQPPYLFVQYRVGESRLYMLKGKYMKFLSAYNSGEDYKIASKFVYSNNDYYFGVEDKKILDFSLRHLQNCHDTSGDMVYGNMLDNFMELLKQKEFIIDNHIYYGVKEENPFDIVLTKENDEYIMQIREFDKYRALMKDYNYIYDDENVYKLSDEMTKLYYMMFKNEMDSLVFKKEQLEQFSNGILSLIQDNVVIADELQDEIVISKAKALLYFDFYYNATECKVKLKYGQKEINLFDDVPGISRDKTYESNIFEKLGEYGFTVDEERFILEETDTIGYFLEYGINELSELYEVFTSKKIQDTKIKADTNARVNFSIGQDNIMKYDFNVSGIDNGELADVLAAVKAKKKYYKLKSGDFLNLENDIELQKFNNLTEDMELANKDIENGGGEIPKYRAIYFDSLKKSRYKNVITTNNLFDDLISKFKSFKDENINLSKKELGILRDYQLTGVKWLYNLYKCGFGGILADEMGLGKSIQLIYFIKLIVQENPKAKILVIAPTSLIYNWKKEFDKFGSELKYKVFAENKEKRLNDLDNIDDLNVLITTYGLVRNDAEKYMEINFDMIAIDEAQNIKNPQAMMTKIIKKLNADAKFALTGTPLENSVMELWSIFDFIMPGYLASYKKFQGLYNIKNVDDESMHKLDNLNMQITYFILRRKKKDVVKELPDKIENNIYVDLEQNQKKLYMAQVQKTKDEIDELMRTEGFTKARFKILQLLTKLRQICIDPAIAFENYKGGRSKIDELVKIVREAKENGHKVLIFTTYKTALDIVVKKLNNAGISSYYIDGSVPSKKRMELVESFNSDDTDAFIITLKAGGTGLNLTAATVVIHLDLWWNPQVENQATDRAHRIGQKETVEVIRLIAKGTIEERILELQNKKRKLAEALIEGDMRNQNQFAELTEKEIQHLLAMDNEEGVLER